MVPTLPLGAHRRPMRPDADLSLSGVGRIVAELLERLDLREVTLVQNDQAAALVLAGGRPERVARLVVSSCEAFDNYPPGLPGRPRVRPRHPGGGRLSVIPLWSQIGAAASWYRPLEVWGAWCDQVHRRHPKEKREVVWSHHRQQENRSALKEACNGLRGDGVARRIRSS